MQSKLLVISGMLLALIAFLFNEVGIVGSVFATIWWFDILMHILGGIWVALSCAWLTGHFGWRLAVKDFMIAALIVGIIWEIFEYALGIGGSAFMGYWPDTIKDLFDDSIGGALGALIVRYLRS